VLKLKGEVIGISSKFPFNTTKIMFVKINYIYHPSIHKTSTTTTTTTTTTIAILVY